MPVYHVFRLKENLQQQFRWAPHLGGVTGVKPKDYQEIFTIDAPSPYAAWHELAASERALKVGDLLSDGDAGLYILKYIGIEEAHWIVPEAKPAPETTAVELDYHE
jgi:hypothetical protein